MPLALAGALGVPPESVRSVRGSNSRRAALVVSAAGVRFAVELVATGGAGVVAAGAKHAIEAAKALGPRVIPTIAAPFLGEAGRGVAEAAGVAWLDLSGNARIIAPGMRVVIAGRPNRFRTVGRPSSVFAPKSARVVRWLLTHPARSFSQREIARSTGMTEGFVSRIVGRLATDGYVERIDPTGGGDGLGHGAADGSGHGDGSGPRRSTSRIRARDPSVLLDAWRGEYDFTKHTLLAGHVAARSGDAATRFVADVFRERGVPHVATGLSAAWQLTRFAAFRVATFFVETEPAAEVIEALGFREDLPGANLWLVVPNDEGVYLGAEPRDGVRCVHPVQAYLDLKGHPERAAEAADHLRSKLLTWGPRG